jgi:succinate-semialdehyde dehydrogenase/glutarate-semialdehyde dehydrogenase
MSYRSVNPATGEVPKTFAEHTDEQVADALSLSEKAFHTWAARPFSERPDTERNSRILAWKSS